MSGVRRFRETDLPTLAGLEVALFGEEAWDAQALQELAGTAGRRLLVAQLGVAQSGPGQLESGVLPGDVVGYALTGLQGDFSELLRIGVALDVQRGGVASQLLDVALDSARLDGADRMLLEVSEANAAALAFYRHQGFVEIDRRRRYYRDRTDALVLQRDLAPLETDLAGSGKMEP